MSPPRSYTPASYTSSWTVPSQDPSASATNTPTPSQSFAIAFPCLYAGAILCYDCNLHPKNFAETDEACDMAKGREQKQKFFEEGFLAAKKCHQPTPDPSPARPLKSPFSALLTGLSVSLEHTCKEYEQLEERLNAIINQPTPEDARDLQKHVAHLEGTIRSAIHTLDQGAPAYWVRDELKRALEERD